MSSENAIEKLAAAYADVPVIRLLIQLAIAPMPYGVGSAIDDALVTRINMMREARLCTFFSELATGSKELTPEIVENNDFLHAYFSTLTAALHTQRKEKIKLFARLLLSASINNHTGSDIFEEFLSILDDLSFRELQILKLLKKFEDTYPYETTETGKQENDLQRCHRFWPSFEDSVERNMQINADDLRSVLNRLNRTGLYENISGSFLGYTGGRGKLTPMFQQFITWIQDRDEIDQS